MTILKNKCHHLIITSSYLHKTPTMTTKPYSQVDDDNEVSLSSPKKTISIVGEDPMSAASLGKSFWRVLLFFMNPPSFRLTSALTGFYRITLEKSIGGITVGSGRTIRRISWRTFLASRRFPRLYLVVGRASKVRAYFALAPPSGMSSWTLLSTE